LGSDKIWQLGLNKTKAWTTHDSISEKPGNGPRHSVIVATGLKNAAFVKTQSITPPDSDPSAPFAAAELLYAESPTPLLYASNRNDPHPEGDAITVLETTPKLKPVAYVRTGLNYIRGMEFVGPKKEYVIAAGMNGGGIKVFKRVPAKLGYLSEVAHLPNGTIAQPSSFLWVNW
ncbi:11554_t:CDS:2, partial [Acaulospora colombiana]